MNSNKTYVLDRKVVSIHSQDRDISKWPLSNNFEVTLPVECKKIISLKLLTLELPKKYYVFSNENQNTKLSISIDGSQNTILINEGSYTPQQMAIELTKKIQIHDAQVNVYYNEIDTSFYFVHSDNSKIITINASEKLTYLNCTSNDIYNYTFNWGLPAYLGFEKSTYSSTTPNDPYFLINDSNATTDITSSLSVLKAPNSAPILGELDVYMEVDKFNSIDEIEPYSTNTNTHINDPSFACYTLHNLRGNKSTFSNYKKLCTPSSNDYGGKHNSAFAKIPLNLETGNTVLHETTFLSNVYFYEPPLERLSKLKFKFRYHDGRLVDFRNYPISITLEINQLKEEISRNYNIRVPESYGL